MSTWISIVSEAGAPKNIVAGIPGRDISICRRLATRNPVPDYSVVSQTALNGRGVALGYVSTCSYLLREGLLIPALVKTLRTNRNYCLITHPKPHNLQLAKEVRDWICKHSFRILTDIAAKFPECDVVASRLGKPR